ncbi:MAG: amino acid ABC transporter permease [Deltaproteobacteria bacterium]|nr:amino acid ABC transporter permease [Deltaproteobacteria bacterium]
MAKHLAGNSRSKLIVELLEFFLFTVVIVWLLALGTERLGYRWQWYRIPRYIFTMEDGRLSAGLLLQGLAVTFKITGVSFLFASLIGLITALFRLANAPCAKALARGYLELIRNTPLLTQLFFIYFVIAPIIGMNSFTSAVLALSLFEGAYASEIIRTGVLSIDRGQWEAAFSLGMSRGQTYRHVILPQAFRRMLPPLTSQGISLVKDSALVSTIAIYDLTMQGQAIVAETFLTFEIWFVVAAIYLAITFALSAAVHVMEKRIAVT